MSFKHLSILLAVAILSACSGDEEKIPLEGERLSVLELQDALSVSESSKASPFELPKIWKNGFWPQAGGYPEHVLENLSLNEGALKKVWSADIGSGSTSGLPLTAQPVVAEGRVFAMDTEANVSAFDAQSGKQVWRINLRDPEEEDLVIGGGLSANEGILYVTNGYDALVAVSIEKGEVLWQAPLVAPSRAAPTIMGNRVFVSTMNNTLTAFDAATGSVLWEYAAIGEAAGLLGAASPAANADIVVPAFSSGEVYALRVENGSVAWSDNLSAIQAFGGLAALSDIKGFPIIYQGLVYAISFGGKMVAIDERTGERIWQKDLSSLQTPWVAGNAVFIVTSDNQVASLDHKTGNVRWVVQLNKYANPESRKGPITWAGPLLAGNRLLLTSSDGRLLEIEPAEGKILREERLGGSYIIPPVVAGDTLYLLSEDGSLSAYR